MLTSKRQYADLYTWSHLIGDDVVAHQDGAVSVMIAWDGIDAEMLTETERAQQWSALYTMLGSIGVEYCAEFHLWREWDASQAQAYLAHGAQMTRGAPLAGAIREAMAEHLGPYGQTNELAVVLTRLPVKRLFGGARCELVKQAADAQALLERAGRLISNLPGGRVVPVTEYVARIVQSYDRDAYARANPPALDPRFLLAEQLLREAPVEVDRQVRVGESLTKVLLVYLYPDAAPAWFAALAALPIPLHVVHVVRPIDTKSAMRASERESNLAEGTLSKRGADTQAQTISDLAGFRSFVAAHGLAIFQNSYIIHLHGTAAQLNEWGQRVIDAIEQFGGQARDAAYIQLPYFRSGQPGQGYRTPVFRPDHTWQVANMLPAQTYRAGDAQPESLRLGHSGQLIGFNFTNQPVTHSFTVAMTGGGKGVDKVVTIAETFPFGIDWYILEIGGSYKWAVEGFGGVYTAIDPNDTVVNPLPPYAVANHDAEVPLDAVIAGGTVGALGFLLTDGRTELDVHETAAAQTALQLLYAVPDAQAQAPTLPDFLASLEQTDYDTDQQRQAAQHMAANLHSFLETAEGRIFARRDNLVLSEGITGVDLKEVDRASPKLLKFYLVFLSLRFKHLAFARRNPARVLLDEMHKFVKDSPEVVGRLISELARMGRKDNAAIDLVTQGIAEIDVIEKEVLNSMPLRSLLYRSDEWDHIADRINMPAGPLEIWRSFPYPLNLPYRPAIRSVVPDYYNLHLTFPTLALDLASTSPDDLDLKDRIGRQTADPLERLRLFREAKDTRRKTA